VILLALQSNPTRSLSDFLFGDVLANSRGDVVATVVISLVILAGLAALQRAALACSFDRAYAASIGFRPGLVDALLLSLVAATVVVAILAVGNVLALALLIAPAATARLLVGRIVPMMLLAAVLGACSGFVALELSYWWGLAAGSAVVLCASGAFVLAFAFSQVRAAWPVTEVSAVRS
jgi:manganese/iron transport system permease protein